MPAIILSAGALRDLRQRSGGALRGPCRLSGVRMSGVWNLNLIHFFDFYLAATFLLSIAVRLRQYGAVLALLHGLPGRWPRLLDLVKQHRSLLVTRETVAPGGFWPWS